MKTTELTVQTARRRGLFDLTDACERFVAGEGDGLLTVFVPHATAGLVVVELGAGSDSDLMASLDRLIPRDEGWVHRHGSPGHGADHLVSLLAPPSLTICGRGPPDSRHLAVDSAPGPQSGQRRADGQARIPARLNLVLHTSHQIIGRFRLSPSKVRTHVRRSFVRVPFRCAVAAPEKPNKAYTPLHPSQPRYAQVLYESRGGRTETTTSAGDPPED